MSELKCPNCGSLDVRKTVTGKAKEYATAFAAGVALGVAKEAVNSVTYGVGGRLIPTSWAAESVQLISVDHECQNCDCIFKIKSTSEGVIKSITTAKLPMPVSIINSVRNEYILKLRKNRPFIGAVIFGLLTLYCLIYTFVCATDDSFWVSSIGAFGNAIFTIIFAIPTIWKVTKINRNNNEIKLCECQSPREFKITHRDLFYNYSEYN